MRMQIFEGRDDLSDHLFGFLLIEPATPHELGVELTALGKLKHQKDIAFLLEVLPKFDDMGVL